MSAASKAMNDGKSRDALCAEGSEGEVDRPLKECVAIFQKQGKSNFDYV